MKLSQADCALATLAVYTIGTRLLFEQTGFSNETKFKIVKTKE